MNFRVLVTDSSYKHTLGACRALGASGYDVQVIGPKFGQAGYSKSVEKRHIQRGYALGELSKQLEEIAESEKIQFLLPIGAASVFDVSANRQNLSEKLAFALAPTKSIDLALNKANLLSFAESVGVSSPRTWRFSTFESFLTGLDEIPFPYIIKSALEQHKFGPVYINSSEDIEKLLSTEVLLPEFTHGELVAQSRIRGNGEGFFALYQHGVCKRVMMHKRLREMPATGGSSWAAQSIYSQDLFDSGVALLDALEWHGPAMVEFKRDETDGKLSLMELNPKFWGSLDLAIQSGVDFPSDTVRIASGEELDANFHYKSNVKYVWPLENYSLYLRDAELRKKDFQTNVDRNDFLPAVVTIASNLAGPIIRWLSKSIMATTLGWRRKYNSHQFMSRVTGQLIGIPARTFCQIDNSLWVGAKPKLLGRFYLRLTNRHIYSLLHAPGSANQNSNSWRTFFPLDEFVDIPFAKLSEITKQIDQIRLRGGKVFIHCREGVGRAPTVAAAVLISQGLEINQAIQRVKRGRDVSSINSLQLESLTLFANQQHLDH